MAQQKHASASSATREKRARKNMLEGILRDIDIQKEHVIKEMYIHCKQTCSEIDMIYEKEIAALPEEIKNMPIRDYLALQATEAKKMEEIGAASKPSIPVPPFMSKLIGKNLQRVDGHLSEKTTKEEPAKPARLAASSRKQATGAIKLAGRKGCLCPPSMKLDAVTPKFDPRLPVSPQRLRLPRPGEPILSLSGSPLVNSTTSTQNEALRFSVRGKQVSVSKQQVANPTTLDESTKDSLVTLQKKLNELLQDPL